MTTTATSRTILATAALTGILLTGACSAGGDSAGDVEPASGEGRSMADDGDMALSEEQAAAPEMADDAAAAEEAGDASNASIVDGIAEEDKAFISTGTISLASDDVADSRQDVQKVIDTHQGTISQQETSTDGEGGLTHARLVLRIPTADFTEVIAKIEQVATLLDSTQGSDEVTDQVIDTDARVRAQEKSVRRIEALLAEADDLRTLMSIESELARRQADLDSLKSRQAHLKDQTSMATLTVYIERTEDAKQPDDEPAGFLSGFKAGWDAFVATATGAAAALGFLVPWLGVGLAIALVVWLLLRGARGRRTPATPPPATPADS